MGRRIVAVLALALCVSVVGCSGDAEPTVVMSDAVAISTNQRHGCGLHIDGSVGCWGANLYGQLGNGSTEDAEVVGRPVSGVAEATSVSAGDDFSCAVIRDGSVRCWGFNLSGQIGDGTTLNIAMESEEVIGVDSAQGVAAGGNHACSLLDDATVRCWGGNEFGQLGDGSTEDRLEPVEVVGLRGVRALSAGSGFTCAVLSDASVSCWGVNGLGQLGDVGGGDRTRPVDAGLRDVVMMSSGSIASCAVLADGGLRCWGGLDGGTRTSSTVRGPGSETRQIAVGDRQVCVVEGSGRVLCAEPGDLERLRPVQRRAVPSAPSIGAAADEVCTLGRDRRVRCDPPG